MLTLLSQYDPDWFWGNVLFVVVGVPIIVAWMAWVAPWLRRWRWPKK